MIRKLSDKQLKAVAGGAADADNPKRKSNASDQTDAHADVTATEHRASENSQPGSDARTDTQNAIPVGLDEDAAQYQSSEHHQGPFPPMRHASQADASVDQNAADTQGYASGASGSQGGMLATAPDSDSTPSSHSQQSAAGDSQPTDTDSVFDRNFFIGTSSAPDEKQAQGAPEAQASDDTGQQDIQISDAVATDGDDAGADSPAHTNYMNIFGDDNDERSGGWHGEEIPLGHKTTIASDAMMKEMGSMYFMEDTQRGDSMGELDRWIQGDKTQGVNAVAQTYSGVKTEHDGDKTTYTGLHSDRAGVAEFITEGSDEKTGIFSAGVQAKATDTAEGKAVLDGINTYIGGAASVEAGIEVGASYDVAVDDNVTVHMGVDMKADASASAQGHFSIDDIGGAVAVNVGTVEEAGAGVNYHKDGVTAGAEGHVGSVTTANANAAGTLSTTMISAHAGAMTGAFEKIGFSESAGVDGWAQGSMGGDLMSPGVFGAATYGSASYDDGHLEINFGAQLEIGIGGLSFNFSLDIDLKSIAHKITYFAEEVGGGILDGFESAGDWLHGAADTVADGFKTAFSHW